MPLTRSMTKVEPPTFPQFFRLPRELRDEIYGFAVVHDDPSVIPQNTTITEPGLLTVCRQVREEAALIFYKRTTFDIECSNWDFRTVQRAHAHVANQIGSYPYNVESFVRIHAPHWPNLRQCLEAMHRGEGPNIALPGNVGPELAAVNAMLSLVLTLREMEWGEVMRILARERRVLVKADARWDVG